MFARDSGSSLLKLGVRMFNLVISEYPPLAFSMFRKALVGFSLSSRLKAAFFWREDLSFSLLITSS